MDTQVYDKISLKVNKFALLCRCAKFYANIQKGGFAINIKCQKFLHRLGKRGGGGTLSSLLQSPLYIELFKGLLQRDGDVHRTGSFSRICSLTTVMFLPSDHRCFPNITSFTHNWVEIYEIQLLDLPTR